MAAFLADEIPFGGITRLVEGALAKLGPMPANDLGLLIQKCLATQTEDVDAFIKKAFEEAVAECKYKAGQ